MEEVINDKKQGNNDAILKTPSLKTEEIVEEEPFHLKRRQSSSMTMKQIPEKFSSVIKATNESDLRPN